jgi:hypothetical protein
MPSFSFFSGFQRHFLSLQGANPHKVRASDAVKKEKVFGAKDLML